MPLVVVAPDDLLPILARLDALEAIVYGHPPVPPSGTPPAGYSGLLLALPGA